MFTMDAKRHVKQLARRRRGATLIVVLIISVVLLVMAGGLVQMATYQTRDRVRYEIYKDEFCAAEMALNKTFGHVQFLINNAVPNFTQELESMPPPTVQGFSFPVFSVEQLSAGQQYVDEGQWKGLSLYTLRYRIDVTAKKEGGSSERFERPGVGLREELEITYIPLFLFAIFYDPVMEIAPGPLMIVNGRVHSNGDAYIQSGSGLDFLENVSVAGNVYHGSHAESGQSASNGQVRFTGSAGGLTTMQHGDDDGWLTSTDADWLSESVGRWDDGLRDQAHGTRELGLPLPMTEDPHVIIERADPGDSAALQQEKLEYKAGLKILADSSGNIKGYDQWGNEVDLTYPDPDNPAQTKSVVEMKSFYDAREGAWVKSLDVNIGNMVEAGIKPANGILYVSNEDQGGNPGVVRLKNGEKLPVPGIVGGFTVATDDAIYIKGDYNTQQKSLSMVAADALYILSNNWDDANSNNYGARTASATEVNTVAIGGIVPSAEGNYSGGVENFFRFMEKWDDQEFRFSGSIIHLYESQKALGKWLYGDPVYTAPIRNWSWDTDLGGISGPPGTPRVVEITKGAWELRQAQ